MKKKDIISIIALLFVTIFVIVVYRQFYYIDLTKFQYNMMTARQESPDGEYLIELFTVGEKDETIGDINDTYYVYARLFYQPDVGDEGIINWSDINSKIIYFQKDSNEVSLKWLDNKTALINGVELDVTSEQFDYRRKLI